MWSACYRYGGVVPCAQSVILPAPASASSSSPSSPPSSLMPATIAAAGSDADGSIHLPPLRALAFVCAFCVRARHYNPAISVACRPHGIVQLGSSVAAVIAAAVVEAAVGAQDPTGPSSSATCIGATGSTGTTQRMLGLAQRGSAGVCRHRHGRLPNLHHPQVP